MPSLNHRLFYRLVRIFHFRWLFLLCRRYLYDYVTIEVIKDWGKPQKPFFFKKEADLYSWYYRSAEKGVEWLEQGVYARQVMTKDCKVLDLCTGDGFFPYMFYADFAARIDAVDFDESAITHAKANYSAANINHVQMDILKGSFPLKDYDVVIWNTALDYFSREQQLLVLDKIIDSSKPEFVFVGAVPKVGEHEKKHSDNHVKHFANTGDLRDLFSLRFEQIEIFHTDYKHRSTFYFKCKGPKSQNL
ncbi:MAG: class I SAM-dependent methyltransferase [Chitinophagales bacterium]|nr:class I SAM-dependent methyltransferase [Chitinophagales bacterium]